MQARNTPTAPPRLAATWRCCHWCGTLYTLAHPCPCRRLAHELEVSLGWLLVATTALPVVVVLGLLAWWAGWW